MGIATQRAFSGTRIALADNDPELLKTRSEFLESQGFEVEVARDVSDAERVMAQEGIRLAVVDLRLVDEDDKQDRSGLKLAGKFGDRMPVIIQTLWPSDDVIQEWHRQDQERQPTAYDIIDKRKGQAVLLAAIYRALYIDASDRLVAVQESIARLHISLASIQEGVTSLPAQLRDVVQGILDRPPLKKYVGVACARVVLESCQATSLEVGDASQLANEKPFLEVWLQPTPPNDESFWEDVSITDGEDAPKVSFEIVVESDVVQFSPSREELVVDPGQDSNPVRFGFSAPKVPGEYKAWVNIFQSGRTIQVIPISIIRPQEGG